VTNPGDGWQQEGAAAYPQYQGPPPTAPHDPGSTAAPYPNPYAYPYPSGYGYPGAPPGQRRPGTLTASAVLGYVTAGLLIVAGLLLFTGASLVNSVDDSADGVDLSTFTTELTFDGVINLLAGGLLIAGGVRMSARAPNGRALYGAGAAIVIIESIYWLARWGSRVSDASGIATYGLIFGALAVVGVALACTGEGTRWLSGQPVQPVPPYGR
jgi:hypothetical protein